MLSQGQLSPITDGAEVLDRPYILKLTTGEEIRVEPTLESLDEAEAAIREAARRMGVDGRVMFVVARRQLGDIAATRAALSEASR